ncbi:MAG: DUF2058 family protein [Rhodanobacteraceae bacterium]|nr:DUF2058 family protein [Rhodanobacteraceae bacterium]MBK7043435.1 DUF2058 family protein [Rhodanobacteraceae bacterium]MBP9155834.1 DUF2058 family protein [Xanthomonadales bacterium]HQW82516.1 DUF2058 family protein [Pseudomonadota bacterium]
MTDSLRDQLIKLGYAANKPEPPKPRPVHNKPHGQGKPHGQQGKPLARPHVHAKPQHPPKADTRSQEEIDLARAYALRAKAERQEAEAAKREAEKKAQEKRERKIKLGALLEGKAQNIADAEHPRHFEHQGKIKRVYCSEAQVTAINAGDLGIVMQDGHFRLVARDIALAVGELEPRCLLVLLEPGEFDAAEALAEPSPT